MMIQTYREAPEWRSGTELEPLAVMDKECVHAAGALHRSVHFLALDQRQDTVLLRKRSLSEHRYGGLFTSTAGVHVDAGDGGDDYERSLRLQVSGIPEAVIFVGEFRVQDPFENEVCGVFLHFGCLESLARRLAGDHQVVALSRALEWARSGKTTPHLSEALKLLI